jgi:hypothetical protein
MLRFIFHRLLFQGGFVKSTIVAPLPVVGPRVRGNVPEVITYRIGDGAMRQRESQAM